MSGRRVNGGIARWPSRLALLLLAILASACEGISSPTEPDRWLTTSEIENHLVALANHARRSAGIRPDLVTEIALAGVARRHSEDMRDRGYLGHDSPEGTTLRQRLEQAGIDFSRAGENLVQVTRVADPADFAHSLLMDSQRHRANILDDRFSLVGVGVARSAETFWVTEIFIRR